VERGESDHAFGRGFASGSEGSVDPPFSFLLLFVLPPWSLAVSPVLLLALLRCSHIQREAIEEIGRVFVPARLSHL
jgi:hypothetical protein